MKKYSFLDVRWLFVVVIMFILDGCGKDDLATSVIRKAAWKKNSEAGEHAANLTYVRIPSSFLTKEFIKSTGFNRDEKFDDVYAFGYIDHSLLPDLPAEMRAEIVEIDEDKARHVSFDPKTLEIKTESRSTLLQEQFFKGYHNYAQLKSEMESIALAHPDLAKLESAGKSVQGKELFYLHISDKIKVNENEPKLLYIANMHGDEVVGREMLVLLAHELLDNYDKNKRYKGLVDNSEIFLLPSMNPDGFEKGTRYNANGYDLNRSFPDFINGDEDSENSKPAEIKAIMQLHQQHHFSLAYNYHGGALCVNLSWDTTPNENDSDKFEDDKIAYLLGRDYADHNQSMSEVNEGSFDHGVTYGYEWFEVDGGMQDWANHYRKSIHAVVELGDVKWPSASSLVQYWSENKESMLRYFEAGLNGVHIEVIGDNGSTPGKVTIGVDTSRRSITFKGNFGHLVTPDGQREVTISSPGYSEAKIKLKARSFSGKFDRIVLKKK